MHETAEYGIAAHVIYKEGAEGAGERTERDKMTWLRHLLDTEGDEDPTEFLEALKVDLFEDEVFVFTPKGEVKNLSAGSTPLDFAYSVHTDVGHRCVGAKVNGKIVPLHYPLQQRRHRRDPDLEAGARPVARLAGAGADEPRPQQDPRLAQARAPRGRRAPRPRGAAGGAEEERPAAAADRRLAAARRPHPRDGVPQGRRLLHRPRPGQDLDQDRRQQGDAAAEVGRCGRRRRDRGSGSPACSRAATSASAAPRTPPTTGSRSRASTTSSSGSRSAAARCPGDEIVGYVSLGRGITIHREDCKNVKALMKAPERFTDVSWAGDNATSYRVELQVDAWDRTRLLEDLSRTFSEAGVNILEANCSTKHPMVRNRFVVEVGDSQQLKQLHQPAAQPRGGLRRLSGHPDMISGPHRRPAVSVVVPLRGDRAYAARCRRALERLELGPGGRADRRRQHRRRASPAAASAALATRRRRSRAALLVLRPQRRRRGGGGRVAAVHRRRLRAAPDLLDRYFAEPIGERCGAVAGGIVGVAGQDSLLTRYARDRNFLDQAEGMHGSAGVAAATGNLLVRRATFDELGGFADGIRSGGDVDFCWRMRDAGWTLEQRPAALVEHHHREDLRLVPRDGRPLRRGLALAQRAPPRRRAPLAAGRPGARGARRSTPPPRRSPAGATGGLPARRRRSGSSPTTSATGGQQRRSSASGGRPPGELDRRVALPTHRWTTCELTCLHRGARRRGGLCGLAGDRDQGRRGEGRGRAARLLHAEHLGRGKSGRCYGVGSMDLEAKLDRATSVRVHEVQVLILHFPYVLGVSGAAAPSCQTDRRSSSRSPVLWD